MATTNGILPNTAICCNGLSNAAVINATCCQTCCDGAEDASPSMQVDDKDVVLGVIAFSLVLSVLCLVVVVNNRVRGTREKVALQAQAKKKLASQERKRKRKESISKGLIVKEWVLDDAPAVESTEGDQDSPPSDEVDIAPKPQSQPSKSSTPTSCGMGSDDRDVENTPPSGEVVEASQPLAAEPIHSSSSASCAMGGADCDPLVREEETAGCAICLSQFKSQQLVCESNNSSCRHIFHKDCMVDWLMKNHEECPMCREVYLVKTV
jgi:hypothetical protein